MYDSEIGVLDRMVASQELIKLELVDGSVENHLNVEQHANMPGSEEKTEQIDLDPEELERKTFGLSRIR